MIVEVEVVELVGYACGNGGPCGGRTWDRWDRCATTARARDARLGGEKVVDAVKGVLCNDALL